MRRSGGAESTVVIAGVPVAFRFAGAEMESALFPALAHHAATADEPRFTVLAWDSVTGSLPLPPFPWRLEDVGPKGEVPAATSGSIRTAYSVGSRVLSSIDLESRTALCWTPDAAALPWYERAAPMRSLIHWILDASGCNLMHAAAVAPAGSLSGALLAGRGGSGKSTTAMLCLKAGFRYVGDDYVAVRRDAHASFACSLFSTAKLSQASLDWLSFLQPGLRVAPEGDEKGVVMLRDVVPDQLVDEFRVRALIVPRVTGGGASRIRRSSSAAALIALAPTTLFQLPGAGADTFERIAAFARDIPAWSLELGTDFDAIPRLVRQAVEES
jgi:hypothetical protein